jgi:hypothetical protein
MAALLLLHRTVFLSLITVVWDVRVCSLVDVFRYFRVTYCLQLQGERADVYCLYGLFFEPEDGNNTLLQSVGDFYHTTWHHVPPF